MAATDGYYSVAEIVAAASRRLGEPNPDAAFGSMVEQAYRALHAEMTQEGYADWPLPMCPLTAYHGVIGIVAGRCAVETGVGDAAAMVAAGWRAYFAANAVPASALPVKAVYY